MKKILVFIFLAFSTLLNAQLNMDSVGRINYILEHATMLNDVWGYVDETGVEYGLIGAEKGTAIAELSDPSNPTEVFWEPGMESIWRDLKTWGDYAYVTTEALNGLLIIDMSPLPASNALTTSYYTGPNGSEWQSAHNLFIDSSGYAYIFGANRGNGGVIILDVHTDPMNPIEVGVFDNWYVHDGFVQRDTMYLGHINEGFISMVDVSDKANPVLLGTATTPSTFSHNIWTTANGQFAFTTDEVSDGYIGAYDVSDPTNIFEVDRIQSSPGAGVIPHNTHVLDNYIITSYYSDGVVVHDVTYPYNMVEVANYDTYFDQTTSFDGCWGAYPYLPSGLILATDRSEGFFVLSPDYSPAAYLEGVVTNSVTANPLDQVEITIAGHNQNEYSATNGFYATGIANAGTYDVTYFKVGYYSQTISTTLINGVIVTQDVQLVPIPPFNLTVNVYEEGTNNPIDGAFIKLKAPLLETTGQTNALGQEDLVLYYEDLYKVKVGKWGYITHCSQMNIDDLTADIDIYLAKGYYDDYNFDFGWSSTGTASVGLWERGVPIPTNGQAAPGLDSDDCGENAYVTGLGVSLTPSLDDVAGGTAILSSPVMDLSGYTDPYVSYEKWFFNFYGPNPPADDTLQVMISNGLTNAVLERFPGDTMNPIWRDTAIRILDYISLTSTMQIFFSTSDLDPNVNVCEAGIDHFFIAESSVLDIEERDNDLVIFPNPTTDLLSIRGGKKGVSYEIVGVNGVVVSHGECTSEITNVDVSYFETGTYFLVVENNTYKFLKSN
ncbi:MAG: choice-of-anchor B family protein [Crocinitomicaceae bacterium]|nr:choice-of-anchor B family protein [Crocinitomicaceae bacterium]